MSIQLESIDDWLSKFIIEVTSGSEGAYNNGNQQIMITLMVEPKEGEIVTEEELKSLLPTVRQADGTFKALDRFDDTLPWGWNHEHDARFDFLSGQYPAQNSNPLSKVFYIHTRATGGSTITLHAQITRDGQTYFTEDGFESSITLRSVVRPTYTYPADYGFTRTFASGDWEQGSRFIHEHNLSLNTGRFVEASLMSADDTPASTDGMLRWQRRVDQDPYASNVGFALPGNRQVKYHASYKPESGFAGRRVKDVVTPNMDSIVVVVQGDDNIPYIGNPQLYDRPCHLRALDNNGNVHRIRMSFKEDEDTALKRRTHLAPSVIVQSGHAGEVSDFADLKRFQVKAYENPADNIICPLYKNGYQQAYICVLLEPVNENGERVVITDSIKNAISLYNYDTGEPLSTAYTVSKERSANDKRFDRHPQVQGQAVNTEDDAEPNKAKFWIKTTTGGRVRIAARLTHKSKTYHTRDNSLPPGGAVTSGASNSSVTLDPRAQDYFYNGAAGFDISRFDITGTKDIDEYQIRFRSAQHRIVHSTPTSDNLFTLAKGHDFYSTNGLWYFAVGPQRTVKVAPFGANWPEPEESRITINRVQGTAYAARVTVRGHPANPRIGDKLVYYIDQFGNTHSVTLVANRAENGNTIELG
ncbi:MULTISPECIES: hypothetical protein [Pseudomonas]|uniref:Uncharacterized protein n=1 Tax=Pseudomonas entomophila TaxID=312306 RepID=A0A3Q8U0N0_9PSED|nr:MULTISPECIES: hypothetical protein [Pseudomonas]AZL68633.1 hypothetical protein EJA05_13220 [Pseudomonas oryziphila]MDZ4022004.1 hypothetical protein [Pseudomonas sichuanensis]